MFQLQIVMYFKDEDDEDVMDVILRIQEHTHIWIVIMCNGFGSGCEY